MAAVTIVMPAMGESVIEAHVLRWLKQKGDTIALEESILEIATDKVDSEVPSPQAGVLEEILVQAGTVVKIGAPIAIIATQGEEATAPVVPTPAPSQERPAPTRPAAARLTPAPLAAQPLPILSPDRRFYSPLVRHIAQQEGIAPEELRQIPGTGQHQRVTQRDLLAYLKHRPAKNVPNLTTDIPIAVASEDTVIPMDRMRQLIAARMVASKQTAPHVTSFVEADVTDLVHWRAQRKAQWVQKTGVPLTYTALFLQAIVRALQDFPMLNAYVATDRIIQKKAIHLGLAVALPDGNLMVPVIKHADQCSLADLAHQVHTLAHKARTQQLVPDEVAGATYTVSNLGSFQNLMGTPIIMQPQVAIMALGAIVKKPAVIASEQGDQIAIRHKMYLSHSYDHRVIDGAQGGGFAKQVAHYLETFVDWCADDHC